LIEHLLNHLVIYAKIPQTVGVSEVVVKILAELLSALALATQQIEQGKLSKTAFGEVLYYLTPRNVEKVVKKLVEEKDVEAVLQRLDRLTQGESWKAALQILEVVYGLIQNIRVIMDGEQIH
jgi:hypothetical protein